MRKPANTHKRTSFPWRPCVRCGVLWLFTPKRAPLRSKLDNQEWTWSLTKFENRLFMMRDIYAQFKEGAQVPRTPLPLLWV